MNMDLYNINLNAERDAERDLLDDTFSKWTVRLVFHPKESPVSWMMPGLVKDIKTTLDANCVNTPYGKVYGNPDALKYVKELVDDDVTAALSYM